MTTERKKPAGRTSSFWLRSDTEAKLKVIMYAEGITMGEAITRAVDLMYRRR